MLKKLIVTSLVLALFSSTASSATMGDYTTYFNQGDLETTSSKNINGSANSHYDPSEPESNISKTDAAELLGTGAMIGLVSIAAFLIGDATQFGSTLLHH